MSEEYLTMDIYEAAAIECLTGVKPDKIIRVEGSSMAAMRYDDKSQLPPRSELEIYMDFKEKFIRLKREVFKTVDEVENEETD